MALYLLPTPRNECVKRAPKMKAKSRFATDDALSLRAPNPASILPKADRFTKWKASQVQSIKGVMRWM